MKLARYRFGGRVELGSLIGNDVHALDPSRTLQRLFSDDGEELAAAAEEARKDPRGVRLLSDVELLSPIPTPPTIRDFYSFEEHVKTARRQRNLDMEPDWYNLPVFYFSNPYATIGTGTTLPSPPGTAELDYELEVAAVLGRKGANLSVKDAASRILAYCVMNDWSARDIQRREMKLSMGPVKGKDFATTLGPWLTTPDELGPASGNAYDLLMTATVNGKPYSSASLSSIYWTFPELVSYASRGTEVRPLDVIGSGTCGTGCIYELSLVHGPDQYPWLRKGDVVTLAVDRLGEITNTIGEPAPLHELRRGALHE